MSNKVVQYDADLFQDHLSRAACPPFNLCTSYFLPVCHIYRPCYVFEVPPTRESDLKTFTMLNNQS